MLHEVTDRHVLLVHGFTGAGPWHWQTWLAGELVGREISVDLPEFPDPDHPVLDRWLPVLRSHLAAAPPGKEVVVLAHSCGTTLWLHHAAQADSRRYRVDRVLLVAPPARVWTHPDVHGFHPAPLDPEGIRRAAGETRLVAGADDPYCPLAEARAIASALRIDMDVVPGGQHLNTDAGYGPWPAVLDWVLDPGVRITGRTSRSGSAQPPADWPV